MPILKLTVSSPDELADLLAWPAANGPINRIQVERSATGGGAGFSNIGNQVLSAGVLEYTYYDDNGGLGDWYRWYYSNAGNSFPTSGNRSYSPEFQPTAEGYGLLCSLGDVKQRTNTSGTNDDEQLLQIIYGVSNEIEELTGRWLAPRPASGTIVYRLHTCWGKRLWVPKGVRSLTTLGIATTDQPDSGGTYTSATAGSWFLDPPAMERGRYRPASAIELIPTGGSYFYNATFGAELTGTFGYAATPPDVREIAINATLNHWLTKGTGTGQAAIGPTGNTIVLRYLAPSDKAYLDAAYTEPLVA